MQNLFSAFIFLLLITLLSACGDSDLFTTSDTNADTDKDGIIDIFDADDDGDGRQGMGERGLAGVAITLTGPVMTTTTTIRARMTNMTRFSVLIQEKSVRFNEIQLFAR